MLHEIRGTQEASTLVKRSRKVLLLKLPVAISGRNLRIWRWRWRRLCDQTLSKGQRKTVHGPVALRGASWVKTPTGRKRTAVRLDEGKAATLLMSQHFRFESR